MYNLETYLCTKIMIRSKVHDEDLFFYHWGILLRIPRRDGKGSGYAAPKRETRRAKVLHLPQFLAGDMP